MSCRGESVRLELITADGSTAAAINLYDINGNSRTLGSKERLVLLTVAASVGASSGDADLFDDINDNGNVNDGERLWHIGDGYSEVQFIGEGQFCGEGRLPKAKSGNAVALNLTGTGYVIAS